MSPSNLTTVRLDDEQAEWLDSQTTRYRKKPDVIRDLIDAARLATPKQGLTSARPAVGYAPTVSVRETNTSSPAVEAAQAVRPDQPACVGQEAVEAVPAASPVQGQIIEVPSERDCREGDLKGERPNRPTSTYKRDIPPHLECHRDLITEFWRIKNGSKSDTAWKLLMTELGKIQGVTDERELRETLMLAINGKWQSITMRNYQRFDMSESSKRADSKKIDWAAYGIST